MNFDTKKIMVIGIFKENVLESIVVQNGRPTFYAVKELDNKGMEVLLETDQIKTN